MKALDWLTWYPQESLTVSHRASDPFCSRAPQKSQFAHDRAGARWSCRRIMDFYLRKIIIIKRCISMSCIPSFESLNMSTYDVGFYWSV